PTAPGAAGTQLPQAAPQIAAVANVGRAATNGTTPANLAPSSPKTAVGKNTILDQQSGEVEAGGNDVKKPVTAFATGASTAPGVADTAAKPSVPQANSQIMAQAMANTPAIPAATAELTPPSLTAPAPVTGDTLGVTQSFNAEMRAAINAPTQAAAYTARGAVTAQPAVEQIAMQITRAADQNIDRMTVHLKPAELGKVTIDLEVGPDNRLLAVISAERSETLDLLQRDSKSLEKALNDAGIKTDSGSLEFNLKGEGGTAENGRDGDGKLHDGAVMLPGDIDATDVNSIPNNTPLILPEGRIDIQV
ncbi:MAG: flagellar hook-length control protein FliK, partial [Alphaproteobacteria bacterium]